AVGGRASSLYQNVLLAAEANQIPDNQKVAGQLEVFDQRQFPFNLALSSVFEAHIAPAITLLTSFASTFPQKRHHGLARRHGIWREFIPQILKREFEARRKLHRIRQRF